MVRRKELECADPATRRRVRDEDGVICVVGDGEAAREDAVKEEGGKTDVGVVSGLRGRWSRNKSVYDVEDTVAIRTLNHFKSISSANFARW